MALANRVPKIVVQAAYLNKARMRTLVHAYAYALARERARAHARALPASI